MICYFSGVGSNQYIAEEIARVVGDDLVDLSAKIDSKDYSVISNTRPIVFVVPVYAGQIPNAVQDYIKRAIFTGNRFIYFVCAYSEVPPFSEKYFRKLCWHKRLNYMGFGAIISSKKDAGLHGEEVLKKDSETDGECAEQIAYIADRIRRRKTLMEASPRKRFKIKLPELRKSRNLNTDEFYATKDCMHCGRCVISCPLNNISIVNGRPVWGKQCTYCMECVDGCPVKAIRYGKD